MRTEGSRRSMPRDAAQASYYPYTGFVLVACVYCLVNALARDEDGSAEQKESKGRKTATPTLRRISRLCFVWENVITTLEESGTAAGICAD